MRTRKPTGRRLPETIASLRSKLARSKLMVATAQSQAQRLGRENQRLRSDIARLSEQVTAAEAAKAALAEDALRASEQLARGQVEALKGALDALATEVVPDRLAGHILRAITEQFGAHGCSAWCCDHASGMIGLEFAFEDGRVITKDDARFAGMDLWLPTEGPGPWPEVFRTGKPLRMADIRETPAFPLRDRLIAAGITTLLLVAMSFGGRVEGVIELRFTHKRDFRPEEMELAQALANQAMLIIQFTRLSTASRDAAIVAERNRIARDIHDTLAQGFTGIIVQLEAAEDATARGFAREAKEHLARARDLARESLNEARRSVHALRPRALDGAGLGDALAKLFEKMTRGTGLQSEFSVVGQPIALPPDWEENLFRVGQEIVTNALRHAHAHRFTARIVFLPDAVRLDLRDDGRGFDPKAKSDGFGLVGIRERVEAMGGQVTVRSAPGEGTLILLTLPRPDAAQGGLR